MLHFIKLANSNCESYGFNTIPGKVISYLVSKINFGHLLAISTNLIVIVLANSTILYS